MVEEGKWLLGVTSFECTISVFNINSEINLFSICTSGHWKTESAEKGIDELNNFLELRSGEGIDLHVELVRKKGLILITDYSLSSLGTFKNEILEYLKNVNYNDFDDLVYTFQLTYNEIVDILDL